MTPDDRLTYAEADRRRQHVARWLLARGVGKGTRVGLFFANGVEWIIWWLAVSRIGAVVVPLSTLYTPAEIAKVVRLADIGAAGRPDRVLDDRRRRAIRSALPGVSGPDGAECRARAALTAPLPAPHRAHRRHARPLGDALEDDGRRRRCADRGPRRGRGRSHARRPGDHGAHLGIDRRPQGCRCTPTARWSGRRRHGRRHAGGHGMRRPRPRILCAMPFFWVGGVLAATGALHEPVTLLVMPRLDAATALDLAERERATGIVGWPAFTQRLREHPTSRAAT